MFHTLVNFMHERPDTVQQALDALLIGRALECIGDHATNVAEDVIFWVGGLMSVTTPRFRLSSGICGLRAACERAA